MSDPHNQNCLTLNDQYFDHRSGKLPIVELAPKGGTHHLRGLEICHRNISSTSLISIEKICNAIIADLPFSFEGSWDVFRNIHKKVSF